MIYGYWINNKLYPAEINNLGDYIKSNTLSPLIVLFYKSYDINGRLSIGKDHGYSRDLIIITEENKLDYAEWLI